MDVKFTFEYNGKTPYGHIYRPVAKVTLKSPSVKKFVDIWMVVDTGADYTIIPRHFSDKLRVSLEKDCTKDTTLRVGGTQTIYFLKSKISAKIGNMEMKIPIAFFDNNEVPALLGRLGFLETFDAEFLRSHVVIFRSV